MDNLISKKHRKKRGGSLTLVVAIGLGVVVVVLFLAIIYSQQFTHQKEAQTAIDSATITVAKELSRLTVADPNLGIVGVCDQFQANGPQQSPIYGINTLVGRARLDAVIARQLNNQDMMLLANRDSIHVTQAAQSLRGAINNLAANDFRMTVAGRPIDLKQMAVDAYNNNPTRAQNSPNITRNQVDIQVGYVQNNAAGLTDIPIPAPNNMSLGADNDNFSGSVGNQRFYRAGVNATVPNVGGTYLFNAITRQPKLVDRSAFTTAPPNANLIPSVVRVTIRQAVSTIDPTKRASNPNGTLAQNAKIEVACATAGGERVPTTAGIFRLEFPQGIPQDNLQGNNFRSILAIMNAGANAWTGNGNFFTAQNGPFPGSGRIAPALYPPGLGNDPTNPANNPRSAATPSQLVSYYVYDWLRNDCLRPNVQSVINVLNAPLRTAPSQVADAQKSIFSQTGEILVQKAYAQGANATACSRIWGGIFALIPNSTQAMAIGSADQRSLNNFSDSTRNTYTDQAYIFRMQGSTPQQLAFAPGQTIAIGINEETGCPTTVNGEPISEALDLREDINRTQNIAADSYESGVNVQDDAFEIINVRQTPRYASTVLAGVNSLVLLPRMNQVVAAINNINAQVAQFDAVLRTLRAGPQYNAVLAQRNAVARTRIPYDNHYNNVLIPDLNVQNGRIDRAAFVMNNAVEVIASISGIPPYTPPRGFPGLINNMRAVSSLGIDRVVPAQAASTQRPRQYQLAGTISFWPLEAAATEDQINGNRFSATGQLPQALGDKNWLGNPRIFTGARELLDANGGARESVETAPGRVAMINCPPAVRPSSQTRNFELVTVGGADNGGGQIQLVVSNTAPVNDNRRGPTAPGGSYNAALASNYRQNAYGNFEATSGVSALLQGQSQYQALNVYSVRSQCDRDPANGRFNVLWSVMAQNNVANFSNPNVDVRNENTDGNRLDCGRAANTGNEQERICDNEAVRIQFTSPLPFVPPLPVLPPPAQPRNPVNAPPLPATPPPPPPAPPPPSH